MEAQERRGSPYNRDTDQPARAHEERTHSCHDAIGQAEIRCPFPALIEDEQLITYAHDGFWGCMDTFKEKQELDAIFGKGTAPWAVWNEKRTPEKL